MFLVTNDTKNDKVFPFEKSKGREKDFEMEHFNHALTSMKNCFFVNVNYKETVT